MIVAVVMLGLQIHEMLRPSAFAHFGPVQMGLNHALWVFAMIAWALWASAVKADCEETSHPSLPGEG
eukprot:gene31210-36950_t